MASPREKEWIRGGEVEGAGKSGGRRNCGWDVISEKRINKTQNNQIREKLLLKKKKKNSVPVSEMMEQRSWCGKRECTLAQRARGTCARSQSICVEESGKYGLSSKEKLVRKEGSMPTVGREARRKKGSSPIVALRVSFRIEREQNLRRCQAPVQRHRICT